MARSSARFTFGPFDLDVDNAELRRDGVLVKLAPQPFALLCALVRQAGELVTRDELCRELWGADRYVDFNAGLNFCVSQLRIALGDSASDAHYIATVPKRGYRFVAAVTVGATDDVAAQPPVNGTVPASHDVPLWPDDGHRRIGRGGIGSVLGCEARAPATRPDRGRARLAQCIDRRNAGAHR